MVSSSLSQARAPWWRRPSHNVVLASCVLLTLSVGLVIVAGFDGLALPVICVGFLPALFLLRATTHLNGRAAVMWWIGAAVLFLFTVHIASSAIDERSEMIDGQPCVLKPLLFENDSVETVVVDWLPPRVLCRYGYSSLNTEELEWESRWWIYWPFALVPLSGLVFVAVAKQTWRSRSTVFSFLN